MNRETRTPSPDKPSRALRPADSPQESKGALLEKSGLERVSLPKGFIPDPTAETPHFRPSLFASFLLSLRGQAFLLLMVLWPLLSLTFHSFLSEGWILRLRAFVLPFPSSVEDVFALLVHPIFILSLSVLLLSRRPRLLPSFLACALLTLAMTLIVQFLVAEFDGADALSGSGTPRISPSIALSFLFLFLGFVVLTHPFRLISFVFSLFFVFLILNGALSHASWPSGVFLSATLGWIGAAIAYAASLHFSHQEVRPMLRLASVVCFVLALGFAVFPKVSQIPSAWLYPLLIYGITWVSLLVHGVLLWLDSRKPKFPLDLRSLNPESFRSS